MRTITLSIIFSFLLISQSNAQALKIVDLEKIFMQSYDKVDTQLSLKGFQFEGLEDKDDCEILKYVLNKNGQQPEYLYKYKYDNGGVLLTYSIFDAKAYSVIKQSLTANGFTYVDQDSYNGTFILKYKKGKVYLSLYSGVVEPENGVPYNAYEINFMNEVYEYK